MAAIFTTLGEMVGEGIATVIKGYLPSNPIPEGVRNVGGKLLQRGVSNFTGGIVSPNFFSGNKSVIEDPLEAYNRNLKRFESLSFLDPTGNKRAYDEATKNHSLKIPNPAQDANDAAIAVSMAQSEARKEREAKEIEAAEAIADYWKNWKAKNWQPSFDMMGSASTTDIPNYLKRGGATSAEGRFQPIISSLAAIGGGTVTGGLKSNPLVSLHKTTNKLLNQVVKNTSNIGNGAASFA
jgi:hypothetical protein